MSVQKLMFGRVASLGPPTSLVTTNSYASDRSDPFLVGFDFIVGASPLTITRLGRFVSGTGNVNRTVKIYRFDSSGNYAEVCSAVVNTNGVGPNAYAWGTASACILLAGVQYLIATNETAGDLPWQNQEAIAITGVASLGSSRYSVVDPPLFLSWNAGTAGNSYGGPNLEYQV